MSRCPLELTPSFSSWLWRSLIWTSSSSCVFPEAMRKEVSQIVAHPEYEKKEATKLMKHYEKYDTECKTVIKQGKAFIAS